MRRIGLAVVLAVSFVLAPLAVGAQPLAKPPTIGLMGSGTAAAQSKWTAAFVQRLRELGWSEGRNIAIEYRWAEGRSSSWNCMAGKSG